MPTDTEIRLLTLLNVSAVKRPRGGDLPGGQRGSPSRSPLAPSPAPLPNGPRPNETTDAEAPAPKKKRKSVSFGGKVGPSGSTYKKNKGKGKAIAAAETNGTKASNGTAADSVSDQEDALEGMVAGDESDENEAGPSRGLPAIKASGPPLIGSDRPDSFNVHFAAENLLLEPEVLEDAEENIWSTEVETIKGLGRAALRRPGKPGRGAGDAEQNRVRSARKRLSAPLIWPDRPLFAEQSEKSRQATLSSRKLSVAPWLIPRFLHPFARRRGRRLRKGLVLRD